MAGLLGFVHTSFILVQPLRDLARRLLPGIETFHAVDESLLHDILQAGGLAPGVVARLARLAFNAQEAGAAAIVLTCSSASPAVPAIQAMLRVPFLAIDEAMAEQAVGVGRRIGLLATVRTTIDPTRRLLEAKALARGHEIEILADVRTEAFDALAAGDRARHDALVAQACRDLSGKVDVIVFAQGSMAPLAEQLAPEMPIPLLTSLAFGVRRAGETLRAQVRRS